MSDKIVVSFILSEDCSTACLRRSDSKCGLHVVIIPIRIRGEERRRKEDRGEEDGSGRKRKGRRRRSCSYHPHTATS